MIFVPVPFVIAVLLLVLFGSVVRRGEAGLNLPFLALIILSAFQSTLLGMRWGYGIHAAGYVSPITAAIVPPLVYAGVSKLVRTTGLSLPLRIALHSVPAILVIVLSIVARELIDLALILIFIGYAVAVIRLLRPGADALDYAPLEGVVPIYRAIMFAASALILSVIIDTLVFLDFSWSRGGHASAVLSVGNLVSLVILGTAAAFAIRGGAVPIPTPTAVPEKEPDNVADDETIARITTLMRDRKVYREANLNLDRLARKAVIPARQISRAINSATGMNVSQYVNSFRIAEACELLVTTQKPVTEIIFDVGFQTKSNFNREFRRITEMTPQDWRSKKFTGTPATKTSASEPSAPNSFSDLRPSLRR